MECQKILNLLDHTVNQPFKFRTRNWVEIKNESGWKYDNSNSKFKTSMIMIYVIIMMHTYLLREL